MMISFLCRRCDNLSQHEMLDNTIMLNDDEFGIRHKQLSIQSKQILSMLTFEMSVVHCSENADVYFCVTLIRCTFDVVDWSGNCVMLLTYEYSYNECAMCMIGLQGNIRFLFF